jgi:hypothetical protein
MSQVLTGRLLVLLPVPLIGTLLLLRRWLWLVILRMQSLRAPPSCSVALHKPRARNGAWRVQQALSQSTLYLWVVCGCYCARHYEFEASWSDPGVQVWLPNNPITTFIWCQTHIKH